ncbi:hypothetical protein [Mycobacteroides abscessus]|uniref:hypothetical protein n=1 Tax=Mycobacteroides abscessus TaxID=36809 RepID=UPI0009A8B878|nr:hypothetical protein [Mycobacteroides abscessus]
MTAPEAATDGGYTVFKAISVRDLPYPQGLGKGDYPELEDDMKSLLGARHTNQDVNAAAFWTPEYQRLIDKHLPSEFDSNGSIVENARRALEFAQVNPLLGQRIYGETDAVHRYWTGLPESVDELPRPIHRWIHWPPRISIYANGIRDYADGRHRTSYLRSKIQPQNPDFEVLVRCDHVTHNYSG